MGKRRKKGVSGGEMRGLRKRKKATPEEGEQIGVRGRQSLTENGT